MVAFRELITEKNKGTGIICVAILIDISLNLKRTCNSIFKLIIYSVFGASRFFSFRGTNATTTYSILSSKLKICKSECNEN